MPISSILRPAPVYICMLLISIPTCNSFVIPQSSLAIRINNSSSNSNSRLQNAIEWDGEPIENAHDDDFEILDNNNKNKNSFDKDDIPFIPSIGFMAMANAVASPAVEAVVSGDITSSTAKLFDRKKNAGKLHQEELNDGSMMSEDDLMEMGGDPFFLVNDNDDDDEKAKKEMNKKKVDLEEEEKWEWDGEPIEGSHDDEFEPRQFDKDSVPFLPSIGFMSMANSISSPALDAVVSSSSSSSRAPPTPAAIAFDRNKNSGILHQIFMEKEEAARMEGFVVSGDDLMEMGGDPSFLAEDDNDNGGYEKMNLDGGWDGTVDEDAHLEG